MPEPLKREIYDTVSAVFRSMDELLNCYEEARTMFHQTRRRTFLLTLFSFILALSLGHLSGSLIFPIQMLIVILLAFALLFGISLLILHNMCQKTQSSMEKTLDVALPLVISGGLDLDQFPMSDASRAFCEKRLRDISNCN